VADHLIVVDHDAGGHDAGGHDAGGHDAGGHDADGHDAGRAPPVVATYRLIRAEAAARVGGFYSSAEYDITPILARPGNVLEVGRSCVHAAYRHRQVMQLLWLGIAAYVAQHDIAVLFGCASLPGTDPDALGEELTYLLHYHLAPPELRARALAGRYVDMARTDPGRLDRRRSLAALPPLIKGYLRLGGFVGDGAVIDAQFNTTDVAVVVKTELVTQRYQRHYERALAGGDAGDIDREPM
jgi:putative hemolysin